MLTEFRHIQSIDIIYYVVYNNSSTDLYASIFFQVLSPVYNFKSKCRVHGCVDCLQVRYTHIFRPFCYQRVYFLSFFNV